MGFLYLAAAISGMVLLVCWIVFPFALIGLKPLLRDLIREQKRTNELLANRARRTRTVTRSRHSSQVPGLASAKENFQSLQRMSSRLMSSPKYGQSCHGDSLAWPVNRGSMLNPYRCTL